MNPKPLFLATLVGALTLGAVSVAGIIPEAEQHQRKSNLHDELSDPKTADAALESVLRRSTALQELEQVALEGTDLSARGRAILGIQGIRGSEADSTLQTLADGNFPPMVKNWAAAARVNRVQDFDSYVQLAQNYQWQFPAVKRPLEMKAAQLLAGASTAEKLKLLAAQPNLAQSVGPSLIAAPTDELLELMQTHGDDNVRRQAASYLAAKGAQSGKGYNEVAEAVIASLKFRPKAKELPWAGGALYVPSIQWKKAEALDLIHVLIQWNVHLEKVEKQNEQRQVQNNLRSVQLLQAAQFANAWPDVNGPDVLVNYGQVVGRKAVWQILSDQDLLDSRWAAALDQLGKR